MDEYINKGIKALTAIGVLVFLYALISGIVEGGANYFILQFINGLTLGGIYALIALGYTMVYGIIQLINFAHGEFFATGGYMGVILIGALGALGFSPGVCLAGSLILSMAYCALLAMAVEKVAYMPLRQSPRLSVLISALGMSIFLQNGLMLTQGVYDKAYPIEMAQGGIALGSVTISYMQILIVAVTGGLLIALNALVFKTDVGRAMRATAQDKIMSGLVGINSNRIISLTFAIGAGLAAAAGILVGMYYGSVRFDMGFVPGVKAFAAAVLGGIGNITGAMLGGLVIGMIEILAAGYISSEYKDVFAFIILIAVLYFRPTGIMGENVDDTRV